jgi:very-short-patch-repair endonuclease
MWHLIATQLPRPKRQYHFAAEWEPPRKWAADFAWPDHKLILEVDGGMFIEGRHNRGTGYTNDRERDNETVCHGWRILRCTSEQVESLAALGWVERALKARP